ncbi:MAG: type 2 lantipeptide synthetase LanM family protein [Clostridiales bacterium]|nr:type 2 lantipeptide synthetase LanM family protein [Clostridiales bacterium]
MQDKDEKMIRKASDAICGVLVSDIRLTECTGFVLSRKAEDDIREGFYNRMCNRLAPLISELFIGYLNDEDVLDTYIDDDEADIIDPYREKFLTGISELPDRFPELRSIVKRTADLYYNYVNELITRLGSSRDEISRTLLGGSVFSTVVSIDIDKGDVHNNGRAATIVTTDKGKIVYKPHDVRIDLRSYELIGRFFGDVIQAPRVCSFEGYGFTEFISNAPPVTEEDAKTYSYNLGGFAAFVQAMGSSDLHHSNVLTRGVYPVIIDYELIMMPSSRSIEKGFAQDLQYSLLYSSLMPSRRGDIEMSVLFAKDEENPGSPIVDGERKCVTDYPDEFMKGFREIYLRCIRDRDDIIGFVSSMKGIYVRHIYRSTRVYSELVKYSMKPGWIGDAGLRQDLYGKLAVAMARSGSSRADDITNAEVDAIMRGDVPYIYLRTDSRALYADGHVVFDEFFRVSVIDNVIARIGHLCEEDLEFESKLLKRSMQRIIRIKPERVEYIAPVVKQEEISNEELVLNAEMIFREISGDLIMSPSGGLCWFGPNYFLETGMDLMGSGFVDGTAGMMAFFALMNSVSADPDIKRDSAYFVRSITESIERSITGLESAGIIYPNVEDLAFSNGLAGKIFGCCLTWKYMEDNYYLDLCRRMIALVDKMDLRYAKIDIFNGMAGMIKVICRFDELFDSDGADEICDRLATRLMASATIPFGDKLIWKTLTPDWGISGAGHGQSGIASALYMAGKRLGRPELIDAAMAGFEFEKSIYSDKLGAWPDRREGEVTDNYITGYCSGAPGIGINALETKYNGSDEVLSLAVRSTLKEQLVFKDFLCCGNCSIIEFLIQAGMMKDARYRMADVIGRAKRQGHYNCINKSLEDVFSPGLFYGVSGIGYEMIRAAYPDKTLSPLL